MQRLRPVVVGCILVAGAMVSGCGRGEVRYQEGNRPDDLSRGSRPDYARLRPEERRRAVRVVFVNNTILTKGVSIALSGEARRNLGNVQPRGGELRGEVLVEYDRLPVEFGWTAGKYIGSFMITRRSPAEIVIPIGHRGRPIVIGVAGRSDDEWDDD